MIVKNSTHKKLFFENVFKQNIKDLFDNYFQKQFSIFQNKKIGKHI